MKLAIIGSHPLALEAALRFHAHEAALTWFSAETILASHFNSVSGDWNECTSEAGWKFLSDAGGAPFEKNPFTWEKWQKHYYLPLIELLKLGQDIKPHKVLSVTKRYIGKEEVISGHSRFFDLFRIIYQLNPEEFINQQKESDPEKFERLSEEFIQSLQSSLEMYADFDLVLDFRQALLPSSIAISGRALGEGRVSADKVAYGVDALLKAGQMTPNPELRELCLVGSGPLAAEILIRLEDWLSESRSRLFVVSSEAKPFESFLSLAKNSVKEKLQSILVKMEKDFEAEVNEFHEKLRNWQELDDFVQVKMPKPMEPIPRLVFFSGHSVTAIDQLIDRKRIFVTLEKPEFRKGLRQPENNQLDLKTVGVDEVLVAHELTKEPIAQNLQKDEQGYFELTPRLVTLENGWKEDLNVLAHIEEEIFKLFTPAGTV